MIELVGKVVIRVTSVIIYFFSVTNGVILFNFFVAFLFDFKMVILIPIVNCFV